jgi:NAD+ diphosphatase
MGLVAGFLETGDTLEECVIREVHEEVQLEITNLKYFGSQPWPYPCGIMIGFTADYVSGSIHLQDEELSRGAWFARDQMPEIPDKMSIARQLIDNWLNS